MKKEMPTLADTLIQNKDNKNTDKSFVFIVIISLLLNILILFSAL